MAEPNRERADDRCMQCGTRNAALTAFAHFIRLNGSSGDEMVALFSDSLLVSLCENEKCRAPLGLEPSILVAFPETREALVSWGTGTREVSDEELAPSLVQPEGKVVLTCRSQSELKRAIADRWSTKLEWVQTLLGLNRQSIAKWVFDHWQHLTGEFFVCSRVLATGTLPGVQLCTEAENFELAGEQFLATVAAVQATVIVALARAWATPVGREGSLEADLKRHVCESSLLPCAAEQAVAALSGLLRAEGNRPIDLYTVECARARVCQVAKLPNPDARSWAKTFLELELIFAATPGEPFPGLEKLRLSMEMARALVPRQALSDEAARVIAEGGPGLISRVGVVAYRLNWPEVASSILGRLVFAEGQTLTLDQLRALLVEKARSAPLEALLFSASEFATLLPGKGSARDLSELADALIAAYGSHPEPRVRLDAWLGAELYQRRMPTEFLARVGESARSFEEDVDAHLRAHLDLERAKALQLLGRHREASTHLQEIQARSSGDEPDTLTPAQRHELHLASASVSRALGDRERALDALQSLPEDAPPEQRLSMLEARSCALIALGRVEEAVSTLEASRSLAIAERRDRRVRIDLNLAMLLGSLDRRDVAAVILSGISDAELDDPMHLLLFGAAWVNCVGGGGPLDATQRQRGKWLLDGISRLRARAASDKNLELQEKATRLLAVFCELLGSSAAPVWELVNATTRELGHGPDPAACLSLAREAIRNRNPEALRRWLDEAGEAFSASFGQTIRISDALQATRNLQLPMKRLVREAVRLDEPPEILRVIGELNRDVLGRLTSRRESSCSALQLPWAQLVSDLGRIRCALVVIECVSQEAGNIILMTQVCRDGATSCTRAVDPGIDLQELGERMTARLAGWHDGRAGDPFDLDAWVRFEGWVQGLLESHPETGAHLVVIGGETLSPLPWHVAAGSRWTASLAPSWSFLLELLDTPPSSNPRSVSLFSVPRFADSEEVTDALLSAVAEATKSCALRGIAHRAWSDTSADGEALTSALNGADVALLLCHGFVDTVDHVTCWLVAHAGALPMRDAVRLDSSIGRAHRFGWQQCEQLERAPAVIFSAACSSGVIHHAGMNEELGLFSTLRSRGTKAFVAPLWGIEPRHVLPILNEALFRWLGSSDSLAACLQRACASAGTHLRRRHAWALTIQGDWR